MQSQNKNRTRTNKSSSSYCQPEWVAIKSALAALDQQMKKGTRRQWWWRHAMNILKWHRRKRDDVADYTGKWKEENSRIKFGYFFVKQRTKLLYCFQPKPSLIYRVSNLLWTDIPTYLNTSDQAACGFVFVSPGVLRWLLPEGRDACTRQGSSRIHAWGPNSPRICFWASSASRAKGWEVSRLLLDL